MEKSLSQKIVEKINEKLNIVPSVLLYDELVGVVASELRAAQQNAQSDLGSKAHFGDPCIYCGQAYDDVAVGDCPSR